MKETTIPLNLARRLAVHRQLLDGRGALPGSQEGVAQTIETLGYIQIDTISVIARAHHHTLWTRRPDYRPQMLHRLLAEDRRIFEYWGHAASYLPMADYRYYRPHMLRYRDPQRGWVRQRMAQYGHLMEPVLERIRAEGPLGSKDFKPPPGVKRGTWWDWKPAKVALELLFWRGELMISERRNFQRRYDLTERVLPAHIDPTPPPEEEVGRFFVRRALSAHGLAREFDIRRHLTTVEKETITRALAELVEAGDVQLLAVEGEDGADYFALAEVLETIADLPPTPARVILLSPFDNLIIERERVRRLFDFDYSLECYVPKAKRKYGYFVLPILWGERLVGRLDPKADRKAQVLLIRNLVFEPDFTVDDAFLAALGETLVAMARFNGCEDIRVEQVSPPRLLPEIERVVNSWRS